jgi:anaerobic ribonucleoside-triphosphate reductase activating protein
LLEKLQAMENESIKRLLELVDIIVDGPFILAEKNLTLTYRGSENQRVIDMVKTRKAGEVVLYKSDYEDLW